METVIALAGKLSRTIWGQRTMTGQELLKIIKKSGLSLNEFADLAKVSDRYLRRAFAGKAPVHDNVAEAAQALELASEQKSQGEGQD
jgi:transcriptional regulator with XRE-family HTH domain